MGRGGGGDSGGGDNGGSSYGGGFSGHHSGGGHSYSSHPGGGPFYDPCPPDGRRLPGGRGDRHGRFSREISFFICLLLMAAFSYGGRTGENNVGDIGFQTGPSAEVRENLIRKTASVQQVYWTTVWAGFLTDRW